MSSQQNIMGFPHLKMELPIHSIIQLPDAIIFSAGQWIQLNELNHPLKMMNKLVVKAMALELDIPVFTSCVY